MMNPLAIQTLEVGRTEYTDSKFIVHTVKHSLWLSDEEQQITKERIAEALYAVFQKHPAA